MRPPTWAARRRAPAEATGASASTKVVPCVDGEMAGTYAEAGVEGRGEPARGGGARGGGAQLRSYTCSLGSADPYGFLKIQWELLFITVL